jgi:hypothetical protein
VSVAGCCFNCWIALFIHLYNQDCFADDAHRHRAVTAGRLSPERPSGGESPLGRLAREDRPGRPVPYAVPRSPAARVRRDSRESDVIKDPDIDDCRSHGPCVGQTQANSIDTGVLRAGRITFLCTITLPRRGSVTLPVRILQCIVSYYEFVYQQLLAFLKVCSE